jgi:conjugal transfer pilus assembly protein TraK
MWASSFGVRWTCAPSAPAALTALLLAAWAVSPAHALQVLDARDGVAVEAILSIKEATRIRIEGAPITDVFGNIHSSNCGGGLPASPGAVVATPAVNPGGEIVLECDRDKGEIYIRPVGESAKPVNLFISSAQATYTLVLRRSDTPADTIVIRDRTLRQVPPASTSAQQSLGPLGPSAHHVRAMKAMLVAMASGRVPGDIRVDELNQPMQLWPETKFALLRRYEGRGLVGEKYLLHNVGAAAMVLAEAEFDREGAQVVGVAVEQHNLRPGESTSVFVIRRGAER